MQVIKRFISISKISQKMNYPSADRNKSFILEVLKREFDCEGERSVLEIASGTGQHIVYFAAHFPNYTFQPSEYDTRLLDSIKTYVDDAPTKNVHQPQQIDVTKEFFFADPFDYIVNVNMFHITPFGCSVGFFRNGGKVLKQGGKIITYGPYAVNGVLEPQSNVQFDAGLKRQNPEWGVRDVEDLKKVAKEFGVILVRSYDLPANNKCLVWQKH
ncbi:unnamed protein product [Brassicogethes aeneus]|uniref:Methyltransferase-like 26 n=1 Tax=Brassicogethes aeneus TaxID=1431903 RepID=A0A9P0FDR2_BRAAE|nr:unnamed protein product [Brassicogethes aeneus]